ncbi:shikimate kinase AroK [Endozoicomonas euniceicola]|uniref:Shikimate kinase n=1 Tax=Endozoicomonas euniceicola TaxID=1234143 RepID=A0ABY6GPK2_9GAMM|nr:shikimate kinase AroK [Endozoicomonas euniceicola]UYM14680.1 shikimate kinase AroK [Endozoicomonas euniceicola]
MPLTNIYLVGPMGAGKSTLGRMLAKELGLPFYDSDHEVEARTGANIPWIFDVEGEKGFRQRERQVIRELCEERGIVLATGGGVVTQKENRRHLGTNGLVVYLKASVDAQLERTMKDKQRPLLQRPDRREVLENLLEEREPLYAGLADLTLDTERYSPKSLINEIIRLLEQN